MSRKSYTDNHSLILFLKILCTFDYNDGILRLWDNHKTRATINKIMKILHFNYDEYNSLMKTLEPFNAIYEVTIGGKRFIQIDERIINALEKTKRLRMQLQTENDKNINQESNM